MSDNYRQYRTIRNALNKSYPREPEGHLASHLNTLAGLISGIVSSRRTNLPQIAAKVSLGLSTYGPVQVILWWEKGYQEPIYLVTNIVNVDQACAWYRKRFRIETFFSDQKSRGFHLHQSHLFDPQRLMRLMMAAGLAYIWIIYLGCMALAEGWLGLIHCTHRCDWSLFQLGLHLRDFFLNEFEDVPVAFYVIPFDDEECVR